MIVVSIYPCPFDNQIRHDHSCSIFKDGKIYSYEESKISTIKDDTIGMYPERSLLAGCKELKIVPSQVDKWILPQPSKNFNRDSLYLFFAFLIKAYKYSSHGLRSGFATSTPELGAEEKSIMAMTGKGERIKFDKWVKEKILFVKHHLLHNSLSIGTSNFDKCVYLSIDGGGDQGDKRHTSWGYFNNWKLYNKGNFFGCNSLANFHSFVTDFCQFGMNNGKVSGLAAYGTVNKTLYSALDKLFTRTGDGVFFDRKRYEVSDPNPNKLKIEAYQSYNTLVRQPSHTNVFDICKGYLIEDVAATSEKIIKDKLNEFLIHIKSKTNLNNIVFSGGLFLNISINSDICEKRVFKNNFFPMAPNDAGLTLGGILYYLFIKKIKIKKFKYGASPFLGPSFNNKQIFEYIKKYNLFYSIPKNITKDIVNEISSGKIVGYFNGKAELGQRSLGARSILADPRRKNSKQKINFLLKKRDWFMPFAPAIISEEYKKWFGNQEKSYYMQITTKINKSKKNLVPSSVHIDDTCRVQIVDKKISKNFWKIIKEFKIKTGIPMLLNTSFNRHGISTISSPKQAIEHLLEGCMDALYIEKYKITFKNNRKKTKIRKNFIEEKDLLKAHNIQWLKEAKKKLDKKTINFFKSELKKKFDDKP